MPNQLPSQEELFETERKVVVKPRLKPAVEEFCRQYVLLNNNGKAAYMAAFPGVKPDTAKVEACKLLKKPLVGDCIAAYRQELREKLESSVINYHRRVLDVDRRDFLDECGRTRPVDEIEGDAALILEFDQVSTKEGVRTVLKVPGRHGSAVELAKILGLNKEGLALSGGMKMEAVVGAADDVERFEALRLKMGMKRGDNGQPLNTAS